MKKTLRNSFISSFIILSLLSPSVALAIPLPGAADVLPPVPVSDAAVRQKTVGLITVFGITIPGLSLDGLMIAFARHLIDNLTNSTINWINSGFHGSPQFMQDPIGDLGNIANGIAGSYIQSIGAGALCSPFRLNIEIALRNAFLQNQRRPGQSSTAQCTFTGTIANLQNFIDGDFSKGGWQGWFEMTQTPTGNPYGSYLQAQATIQSDQARSLEVAKMQADWGQGFLSHDTCKQNPQDPNGPQVCVTRTPGSVINSQLEKVLGSEVDQLNLTTDFNQIMTAILGQLTKRVFSGAQGLLTGNPGGGYSGGGGGQTGTGVCYPSSQTVIVGQTVTWSSSVSGVTNPLYTWSGSGGLTGTGPSVTLQNGYATPGTKTASVTVSGVPVTGGPATSQTIQCAPTVTVNQWGPLTGICTVSPTAAPVYNATPTSTSSPANNVTFTAQITSGGSGVYRNLTWDGDDPTITAFNGPFPGTQRIFPFQIQPPPAILPINTFTRLYTSVTTKNSAGNTINTNGTKSVTVRIIDSDPTVVPLTIQCDQVVIF